MPRLGRGLLTPSRPLNDRHFDAINELSLSLPLFLSVTVVVGNGIGQGLLILPDVIGSVREDGQPEYGCSIPPPLDIQYCGKKFGGGKKIIFIFMKLYLYVYNY